MQPAARGRTDGRTDGTLTGCFVCLCSSYIIIIIITVGLMTMVKETDATMRKATQRINFLNGNFSKMQQSYSAANTAYLNQKADLACPALLFLSFFLSDFLSSSLPSPPSSPPSGTSYYPHVCCCQQKAVERLSVYTRSSPTNQPTIKQTNKQTNE